MAEAIKIPIQVELDPQIKGVRSVSMALSEALGGTAAAQGQNPGGPQQNPAQAVAAAMQQSEQATQRMVTTTTTLQRNLQQLLSTAKQLPAYLGSLLGGGSAGAPGAAGATPAGAGHPGVQPVGTVGPPGSGGSRHRGHWRYQGFYGWQHAMNTGTRMADQGFSEPSVLEGAGSMANLFGPKGAAVGAGFTALGRNMEKEEAEGMERLRLFRQGGNQLRSQYHDLTAGTMSQGPLVGHAAGSLQAAGLTKEDIRSLLHRLAKDGTQGSIMDVGRLEGGYGVGNEAAGLLGAVKRGGGSGDGRDTLARAIGLHVATGLERSRFGEAFTMLSAVVAKQSIADAQKAGQIAGFIGTAGEQYKGDTAGAHSMLSSLTAMATGAGGGGSEIMALSTMMGQGKSYAEAKTALSRGIGAEGADPMAVVQQYAEMASIKSMWSAGKKDEAAMTVAMISGQPQGVVKDILARYYAGGIGDVVRTGSAAGVLNDTALPSKDRAQIDAKNRSDYLWDRGGAWDSGAARRIGAAGGSSPLERQGPVGSTGDFRAKYGDNFGQQRSSAPTYDQHGQMSYKALPDGQTRTHAATDINLPPGSPVFAAAGGTVREVTSLGADYGWVLAVTSDDGTSYRYVHLDQRPPFSAGDKIPAGAALGVTIKKNFPGGSASHLHLGMTDKAGKALNPIDTLGTEGLNRLIGQAQEANGSPAASTRDPQRVNPDDAEESQRQAAIAQAQRLSPMPIPLHLKVTVDDRRVTVQQAGRDNMGGGAGQLNTARDQ